jgi:hypothetical protein
VEEGSNCSGNDPIDGGYATMGGTEQSVARVRVGPLGACAVTTTGDLYCWGTGYSGDGRTTGTQVYFPRKIASGVSDVFLTYQGACALGTDQGMRCWGTSLGAFLADGGTLLAPSTTPMLTSVTAISGNEVTGSGGGYGCALQSTGAVWCGGYAYAGFDEVAPGIPTPSFAPAQVHLSDAGALDTSTVHGLLVEGDDACLIVGSGSLLCWGSNAYGGLGNLNQGFNTDIACIPAFQHDGGVSDCDVPITGVTQVALAANATCVLDASGNVKCLGANGTGELAQGTVVATTTPYPVSTIVPQSAAIGAGYDYFCAAPKSTSQPVVCWGSTFVDELGPNTPDAGGAGTPVTVPGLTNVAQLSGSNQTMCAVKNDGSLWCFGDNGYGQLGGEWAEVQQNLTPVRVPVLAFP